MRPGREVAIYAFLSFAAALLLLVISLAGSSASASLGTVERSIVALAFIACCAFGIVQSIRPRCHRPRAERRSKGQADCDRARRRLVGHHPDCGSFDDHVIVLRGRSYCAGCMGLALGSSLAALAMAALIYFGWGPESIGLPILLVGFVLVGLGLVETAVHRKHQALHVVANVVLVIGFLLVVFGTAVATQNGGYGLIAIVLCLLWMDARVQISDWKHADVCESCSQGCKSY